MDSDTEHCSRSTEETGRERNRFLDMRTYVLYVGTDSSTSSYLKQTNLPCHGPTEKETPSGGECGVYPR